MNSTVECITKSYPVFGLSLSIAFVMSLLMIMLRRLDLRCVAQIPRKTREVRLQRKDVADYPFVLIIKLKRT